MDRFSTAPADPTPALAAPQATPSSVQDLTIPPDSSQAAIPDTASTVQQFNDAFSEAVRLLFAGHWEEMVDQLYTGSIALLGEFIPRALIAFLAFAILYIIYWGINAVLFRVLDHSKNIDAGLQNLLLKTYRVVALVFIGVIVLGQLGVNVTALVAGLSIAGIAVGFAARDSLENFISGVTILMDEPFRVGDYIEVGDEFGEVVEITLRSTRLRTVRNEILVMPNTEMITQLVINHTKRSTLRIDIHFGIAYKEKPDAARKVVLPLVADDDRILSSPEPSVVVTELDDSSVNMALRFFLRDPKQELPVKWEYIEKVREALRDADIEIPFPHLQLFVDEAKAFADAPFMRPPSTNGNGESEAG